MTTSANQRHDRPKYRPVSRGPVMTHMKTYKVHKVCIVVLGIVLFVLGYNSIREFLDPRYHVISRWYFPRALFWYIVAYCWYKFLTIAYKVELAEDGTITAISITKKRCINVLDIISIKDSTLFVDIISTKEIISVSTLMDGVSNISQVLQSLVPKESVETRFGTNYSPEPVPSKPTHKLFRIIIVIILIVYAIYVEWQQIILFSK